MYCRALAELPGDSKWLSSAQADFFGSTLFPTLEIVYQFPVSNSQSPKWKRYLELHPQILDLEASLAEEWFLPELMAALHYGTLRSDLTQSRKVIVAQIQAQIVGYLVSGSFSTRRLADIMNLIRLHPDDFPEWHNSATSELFYPPIFKNKKNADI